MARRFSPTARATERTAAGGPSSLPVRRSSAYRLSDLIATIRVLPISESTAGYYAAVRHALKEQRRRIPPNDSWIAALALEHRLPVLTRDAHFDNILDVERQTW